MPDNTIPIFARPKRAQDPSLMSFLSSFFNKKVGVNLVAALLVSALLIWGAFAYIDHYQHLSTYQFHIIFNDLKIFLGKIIY